MAQAGSIADMMMNPTSWCLASMTSVSRGITPEDAAR